MGKSQAQGKQDDAGRAAIVHFPLQGLLPAGCTLALHTEVHTLSLICEGPELLEQQQLSDNELRVLRPILEVFPYYCSYEVLLASCSISASNPPNENKNQRPLPVHETRNQMTRYEELKPIRRAISSLRGKLYAFHLEISIVRERGCSLTRLLSSPPST